MKRYPLAILAGLTFLAVPAVAQPVVSAVINAASADTATLARGSFSSFTIREHRYRSRPRTSIRGKFRWAFWSRSQASRSGKRRNKKSRRQDDPDAGPQYLRTVRS